MNKIGEGKQLSLIITIFIAAVLGAAFLSVISDEVDDQINIYTELNESHDFSSAVINTTYGMNSTPYITLNRRPLTDIISLTKMTNESGTVWVQNTDYIFNLTNGKINLLNTSNTIHLIPGGNITYVVYTYYPGDYVRQSTGRTIMNIIVLFFAIPVFIFIVGGIVSLFQGTDWVKDMFKR